MQEFRVDKDVLKKTGIPCFRCGVCCMKYSPKATATETEHIAESLGVSLEDFLDRYVDDSWFEPGFYLLDTQNGACIFLDETEDKRIYSCHIHSVRPQVCREWQPSLERKECVEGLQRHWGLTVNAVGKLQGPAKKVQEFRTLFE